MKSFPFLMLLTFVGIAVIIYLDPKQPKYPDVVKSGLYYRAELLWLGDTVLVRDTTGGRSDFGDTVMIRKLHRVDRYYVWNRVLIKTDSLDVLSPTDTTMVFSLRPAVIIK